jgi:DNA-binding NarL/FixJ family response regulator
MTEPTASRRVLLVDDHPIVRHGLAAIIDDEPDLVVSGEASTFDEALTTLGKEVPDIVVSDISLGATSGLELIRTIKAAHPTLPILVVSIHDEAYYAERALRAGAAGYLTKQAAPETVVKAIRKVLEGGTWLSEETAARLWPEGAADARSPVEGLSDREMEVFDAIGRGLGTREIGEALKISIKTVETHRAHIKEKLGLKNATELIQAATRWVEDPGASPRRQ